MNHESLTSRFVNMVLGLKNNFSIMNKSSNTLSRIGGPIILD